LQHKLFSMNENFIRVLIYTHATFGGTALLSGFVALATPKGTRLHKQGGIIFYYTMLAAALLAIIISMMPNHVSYFLFAIGIFSSYMILTGKRILKLKNMYLGVKPKSTEYILPYTMLVAGMVMIVYGAYLKLNNKNAGIVLIVFGAIGLSMAIGDIRLYRKQPTDKRFWLYKHITKMTGGYIAATTAFVVVNQFLPGLWAWLTPTVIGTIYITYHQARFRRKGEKILRERNIE
jgi:hypothetical protein